MRWVPHPLIVIPARFYQTAPVGIAEELHLPLLNSKCVQCLGVAESPHPRRRAHVIADSRRLNSVPLTWGPFREMGTCDFTTGLRRWIRPILLPSRRGCDCVGRVRFRLWSGDAFIDFLVRVRIIPALIV